MKICKEEDCEQPLLARGWCAGHLSRYYKGKPVSGPLEKRQPNKGCLVDGCNRKHDSKGYCDTHASRLRRGAVLDAPIRKMDGSATHGPWRPNANGYIARSFRNPETGKWVEQLQHRLVMEEHLGRPLLPTEEVHHKFGDRTDNDIERLELWAVVGQPKGQRVVDLLEWAESIIFKYKHEEDKLN